ncbi:MAG TPA: hypothetical protein VMW16_05670 [Sedimentisphaerales bacterium]|nr:hypothetical protein [Sedimentisphaerales bacterium]
MKQQTPANDGSSVTIYQLLLAPGGGFIRVAFDIPQWLDKLAAWSFIISSAMAAYP